VAAAGDFLVGDKGNVVGLGLQGTTGTCISCFGLKMGWKVTRLRILVCSSPSGHSGAKLYRPLSYLAALNHAISVLAAISVL